MVWSIVAIFLIMILTFAIFHNGFLENSMRSLKNIDGSYEVVSDNTITGNDIKEVSVDWKSGNIRLRQNDNSDIRFVESTQKKYKNSQLKYEIKDGKLSIKQNKNHFSRFQFLFYSYDSVVDVYLPQKLYDTINVKCTSGQIEAQKIQTKDFVADTTSGKISLSDIKADQSILSAVSGSINGKSLDFGKIDCKATSGRIDIDGSFQNITAKCTSGSLTILAKKCPNTIIADVSSGKIALTIPENDGFTIHFGVTSGSFQSDFELPNVRKGDKSGTSTYKNGGADFDLRVTSGKIELNRG
ncbi:MAG: DUF4097 domain-containing protein [Clostridiales bacterium]|nr:DUF4097 domain-containing protein [Clostridiales bacterium]